VFASRSPASRYTSRFRASPIQPGRVLQLAHVCESVGWLRSRPAVKSQMQIGLGLPQRCDMVSRWDRPALHQYRGPPAHASSMSGSPQHTPRWRTMGSSLMAMRDCRRTIDTSRWIVLGCTHRHSSIGGVLDMSETREACGPGTRASPAALGDPPPGHQTEQRLLSGDGPDCGCFWLTIRLMSSKTSACRSR